MSRLTRLCRTVGVGIAVTTATLAMTQVAHAQLPPPKIHPEAAAIKAPPGNIPFLVAKVIEGTQNYTCTETKPSTFEWVTTPKAQLDAGGGRVIQHSGGPTWTAPDGSAVIKDGVVKSAPSPDPGSIAWLLVPVKASGTNEPGKLLTGTTFIQRVNTGGGLAPPADQCNADTVGDPPTPVNYTADYYFYRAAGKPSNPGKPGA